MELLSCKSPLAASHKQCQSFDVDEVDEDDEDDEGGGDDEDDEDAEDENEDDHYDERGCCRVAISIGSSKRKPPMQ